VQEHRLSVARSARYYSLGDAAARELWIVLHGYGQLAGRFLTQCEALADAGRLVVAPEGLSRFYVGSRPHQQVGASWMTREDRLAEIADYVRYLDAVHADLARAGRADRAVHVLGFSQGAATACRWVTAGAVRARRLVVWGGEIPPDLDLADPQVRARLAGLDLVLVFGTADEYFPPALVAAHETRLRAHDLPYRLLGYEGGHEVTAALLRQLAGGPPDRARP